VRGIGGSSDGRGLSMTAPSPNGQMLALRRAYEDAGVSPATVGLVEAHGTGTVAGDRAEVEALSTVYQEAGADVGSCAIGSVKTNIGHTKCTAGSASLIKMAKSLYHKVLPPTLGVTEPSPACGFGRNPFYVNSEARPWIFASPSQQPRRAAISAFGFGGTNFHAVLEEYVPQCVGDNNFAIKTWPGELFVWSTTSRQNLRRALAAFQDRVANILDSKNEPPMSEATSINGVRLAELAKATWRAVSSRARGPVSMAIVASSLEDLKSKVERALQMVDGADQLEADIVDKSNGTGQSQAAKVRDKDPSGIYFQEFATVNSPRVAFLFPGQGSQKLNMLSDLSLYFPEVRKQFETGDLVLSNSDERSDLISASRPLSSYVYPVPVFSKESRSQQEEALRNTELAQPAMGLADLAVLKIMQSLGIVPQMVAGHSYGEYVALHAAGAISEHDMIAMSAARGKILGATDNGRRSRGAMAAMAAPVESVENLLRQFKDVCIANINAPNQCVVSGPEESVEEFLATAKQRGVPGRRVPVSCAFHSPLMETAAMELERALNKFNFRQPSMTVFSNATAKAYSMDPSVIRASLVEHVTKPVLFTEQVKAMHQAGANVFVEVGPGSVLSALASSILENQDVVVASTDRNGRHGLVQLLHLLAELWIEGVGLQLQRLYEGRVEGAKSASSVPAEKVSKLSYMVNSQTIRRVGSGPEQVYSYGASPKTLSNQRNGKHAVEDLQFHLTGQNPNVQDSRMQGKGGASHQAAPAANPAGQSQLNALTSPRQEGQVRPRQSSPSNPAGKPQAGNVKSTPVNHEGRVPVAGSSSVVPASTNRPANANQVGHAQPEQGSSMKPSVPVQPRQGEVVPVNRARGGQPDGKRTTVQRYAGVNGAADHVVVQFQHSMREMTEQFIEAQKEVMLAYLKGRSRTSDATDAGMSPQMSGRSIEPVMNLPLSLPMPGNAIDRNTSHDPRVHSRAFPPATRYDETNGGNGDHRDGGSRQIAFAEPHAQSHHGDSGNGKPTSSIHTTRDGSNGTNGDQRVAAPKREVMPGADVLVEKLLEIISERTGYPPEMLDPKLDLEADLGIDSIKRVEILNSFRKLLPLSAQENLESNLEELAGTKTLEQIVSWIGSIVESHNGVLHAQETAPVAVKPAVLKTAKTPPVAVTSSLAAQSKATPVAKVAENGSEPAVFGSKLIARGVVHLKPLPHLWLTDAPPVVESLNAVGDWSKDGRDTGIQQASSSAAHGKDPASVLILSGTHPAASALKQISESRGASVTHACIETSEESGIDRFSEVLDAVLADAEKGSQLPDCIFFLLGLNDRSGESRLMLLRFAKWLNQVCAANSEYSPSVIVSTRMGGDFGLSGSRSDIVALSQQAGLCGMTKSIAREINGAKAMYVDLAEDLGHDTMARALYEEARVSVKGLEVAYKDNGRFGLEIVPTPLDSNTSVDQSMLDSTSLVLVTGGARGITAEVTEEVARKYRCNFVILGRQSRPASREAAPTAGLESAREVKAAIIAQMKASGTAVEVAEVERRYKTLMKEREIRNNLARLESYASSVHYMSVDIRDEERLAECVNTIYEAYGNIDGIIHGAGIIEDALLKEKTAESYQRVFDTKVRSAITLIKSCRLDQLKFIYLFSSVVGRTGNAGQIDYVAANEALNKMASAVRQQSNVRVSSLMWGPWTGGMAQPELEEIFASYGWAMINPEAGRQAFVGELTSRRENEVEVLLVAELPKKVKPGSEAPRTTIGAD
ncbi:MAG: SDR family NAD(P)-dependent oxidoreductase, partial [Cyanobacteria bacterium]|nr:SDR family NAD(P)-dependent oxidoreductase [Cyanobacteriota bacterium]